MNFIYKSVIINIPLIILIFISPAANFAVLAFVQSARDGEVVEEWKVSCLLIAATKNNLGNATVYIRSPLSPLLNDTLQNVDNPTGQYT